MELTVKDGKRITMPCFGPKCSLCGWSPQRNSKNKLCQDFRQNRVMVDIKPFTYKKDGRRVWRFPPITTELDAILKEIT